MTLGGLLYFQLHVDVEVLSDDPSPNPWRYERTVLHRLAIPAELSSVDAQLFMPEFILFMAAKATGGRIRVLVRAPVPSVAEALQTFAENHGPFEPMTIYRFIVTSQERLAPTDTE